MFCGLTSIIWLHRKMQDAFFLIVGSRTCAHLMQSAAGVMIFAEPRFATAIIDERDLAGMADMNDELDRVVARLLERRPDIRLLVLVGSCPSEVIKLDLARAAQRLNERHMPQRRVMAYSGSGIETTFTQGEDNFLAELVRTAPAGEGAQLVIAGCIADVAEEQFRRIFEAFGIRTWRFCRRAIRRRFPPSGRTRASCWRSPISAARSRRWKSAAHGTFPRRSRWARKARPLWLRAAAEAFGFDMNRFDAITAPGRERAKAAVARHRPAMEGKRIFLFPDSQMEPSLARFMSREMGADIAEIGTPFLHRRHRRRRDRAAARQRSTGLKARMSTARSTAATRRGPTW